MFPDRHDLFDAFDDVAARGERVSAMRARGGNDDARFADCQAAYTVMHRETGSGPFTRGLSADPCESLFSHRLVRLIFQMGHTPIEVVVSYDPCECRHGAMTAAD